MISASPFKRSIKNVAHIKLKIDLDVHARKKKKYTFYISKES